LWNEYFDLFDYGDCMINNKKNEEIRDKDSPDRMWRIGQKGISLFWMGKLKDEKVYGI
jgi:hypothetical protein